MTLEKIINRPTVTLVDVRQPGEFNSLHAEGAVNIPLSTIPGQLSKFQKMSKPIIVYCASGNRSGQAMNFLKAQGLEDVYNAGGIFQVLGMRR